VDVYKPITIVFVLKEASIGHSVTTVKIAEWSALARRVSLVLDQLVERSHLVWTREPSWTGRHLQLPRSIAV